MHATKIAKAASPVPAIRPETPPIIAEISSLSRGLATKSAAEPQKKTVAKIIVPILCTVPRAIQSSEPKMSFRRVLYRIGTFCPLNHIMRFVCRSPFCILDK